MPSLGVETDLIRLGLTAEGALEVPARFDQAGWWGGGARPGAPGPSVFAGHVDSQDGPAVFYDLDRLRPGDAVEVSGQDGSVARFTVDRVERHDKGAFPTERVYGPVPRPEIRLITCGGTFDRASRHYRDNVIVFGHLTGFTSS